MEWDATIVSEQLGTLPYGTNDDNFAERRVRTVAPETSNPGLQSMPCVYLDRMNRILMWFLPGIFAGTLLVSF